LPPTSSYPSRIGIASPGATSVDADEHEGVNPMATHPAALLISATRVAGEVCVNLFGGPSVTAGGRHFDVPEGGKRLLALVCLNHCAVERRRAAGMLWPLGDDLRAAGNLRSALWRLKGSGIDVVESNKVSLWLRPGTVVDVDLLDDWAGRLISGHPQPGDLDLHRWHADYLDLFPGWYDDWALFEREHRRQLLLHALEALARQLSARNRPAEAVTVATAAVAAEPLRESAQCVLIETHLAEGNLGEARRAYRIYRELALRELEVEPGPRLSDLLAEAARNEPSRAVRAPLGREAAQQVAQLR
jgi:DNA-binding SARP family transcriptional activator